MVRRRLPGGRFVHIERALPFLCVNRWQNHQTKGDIRQLVNSDASYLLASGARDGHQALAALVESIVRLLAGQFGAFLLLEMWEASPG